MRLIASAAIACLLTAAIMGAAQAQSGSASWYALDGNLTANGERMNSAKMTAAHRTLPFGTKLKVTNMRNGKSVIVRINDRGPYAKNRILDLSKRAAKHLGFLGRGHTKVTIAKVGRETPLGTARRYAKLVGKAVATPKPRPARRLGHRLAGLLRPSAR